MEAVTTYTIVKQLKLNSVYYKSYLHEKAYFRKLIRARGPGSAAK